MKKIVISQKDLNAIRSGIPRKVLEEVTFFSNAGHQVHVVAERINKGPYEEAGARTVKTFRWPIGGFFRRKFYNSRFQSFVKKNKPDLIIGHGDILEQDIVYIHNCIHLAYEKLNNKKIPADHEVALIHAEILNKQQFKRLVCNSHMMKSDLCTRFNIPTDKADVIYPEYNPEKFNMTDYEQSRSLKREALGLQDEIVIGLITSGDFKKRNVQLLLKALVQLDSLANIKVIIAGKDKPDAYMEFITSNQLEHVVSFHPSINEVESYYHAIDIFVLPALIEEFGRSVLEAMACGKPVIVSNTVGSSEILEGESRDFILDELDEKLFSEKIWQLVSDANRREKISQINLVTCQKYTSKKQSGEFKKLLDRVGFEY